MIHRHGFRRKAIHAEKQSLNLFSSTQELIPSERGRVVLRRDLSRFENSRNVERLNFQSFFAVGSMDTFSATPRGNGFSPILKTVPDCSIS